ncbi:hypothetical protein L1987_02033 [Smallanthus sonchifolius]|uniref:Uncharacterized protein n=1 Tax=Smallanthus sonchifolius TaxID=185202 RepID=A0ACB9K6V4_9ASTR|nr:hypothetical protein L1987_02033 [Smallanthus sonchifolius]
MQKLALTDEIEQESQTFGEVMRIKEIVDNSPDEFFLLLVCISKRKNVMLAEKMGDLQSFLHNFTILIAKDHNSNTVHLRAHRRWEWRGLPKLAIGTDGERLVHALRQGLRTSLFTPARCQTSLVNYKTKIMGLSFGFHWNLPIHQSNAMAAGNGGSPSPTIA